MRSHDDPKEIAASLERRREAAKGLERDLLTEVPLLYGSPGNLEPNGDPGTVIARIHREELQRRNGGGAGTSQQRRSDVELPFEGAMTALAIGFLILLFFMG